MQGLMCRATPRAAPLHRGHTAGMAGHACPRWRCARAAPLLPCCRPLGSRRALLALRQGWARWTHGHERVLSAGGGEGRRVVPAARALLPRSKVGLQPQPALPLGRAGGPLRGRSAAQQHLMLLLSPPVSWPLPCPDMMARKGREGGGGRWRSTDLAALESCNLSRLCLASQFSLPPHSRRPLNPLKAGPIVRRALESALDGKVPWTATGTRAGRIPSLSLLPTNTHHLAAQRQAATAAGTAVAGSPHGAEWPHWRPLAPIHRRCCAAGGEEAYSPDEPL
jgi:hypothetical protein